MSDQAHGPDITHRAGLELEQAAARAGQDVPAEYREEVQAAQDRVNDALAALRLGCAEDAPEATGGSYGQEVPFELRGAVFDEQAAADAVRPRRGVTRTSAHQAVNGDTDEAPGHDGHAPDCPAATGTVPVFDYAEAHAWLVEVAESQVVMPRASSAARLLLAQMSPPED